MDSSLASDNIDPHRPRKRQRVSRACDPCRNRKTACDGRRPVCMACESRDAAETCTYQFVPKRESLSVDERSVLKVLKPTGQYRQPAAHSSPGYRAESYSGRETNSTPLEEAFSSAPSDGLATLSGHGNQAAYGPSSTVAFLRHIIARGSKPGTATPNGDDLKASNGDRKGGTHEASQPRPLQQSESGQAVLPLRRSADDFLLCYWEFIHPVFPLVHRTTFVNQYERLWTGGSKQPNDLEEPIFMSILNLIFALGCKLSNFVPMNEKATVSDDFYHKSRQLSEFLILDATSVATIQLLALSGVYLQSTQYASRCWNTVGLAIRAAQSLGLHSEYNGRKSNTQLEREMQRRVWHTCVSLDRLVSMTFGRPPMVDRTYNVPLPSMIDDEYLSTTKEGEQPPHKPSRLGAFVFSCKLFELLDEVLNFLSAPALQSATLTRGSNQSSEVLSQVLDLNRRLDHFSESVPQHLRKLDVTSPYTTQNEDHTHLQQRVLHCRLMLVRLLLLRPLLLMATRMQPSSSVQALDGTSQSSLDAELVRSSCNLCLRTAYRLVDAIYYNLNTLYRSSGWHAVYFTFSAAIVLLASLKCPFIEITADIERFETSWTRCTAVFEHYRDQIHSARHAILVLRTIRNQVTTGYEEASSPLAKQPLVEYNSSTTEAPETSVPQDVVWPDLGYDSFDSFGFDNISDAWFGQQLTNLDWLAFPQM